MTEQEYKLHQGVKFWNIILSVLFLALCVALYGLFMKFRAENFGISIFDILVLSLANYRLIRLFIYDNITLFLRELFMDLKISEVEEIKSYEYVNSVNAFKLTMHKLLTCPWCFGVWTTFVSTFFYFSFLPFKILFVLLAISALASFMILVSNLVGWSAEYKKLSTNKL
jgi:hypothetical protein